MKMPMSPPDWRVLFEKVQVDNRLPHLWEVVNGPSHKGAYLHWDKLRHLQPPEDLSLDEWWLALKLNRNSIRTLIPLQDTQERTFSFLLPDPIPQWLHELDKRVGGSVEISDQITSSDTRDRYIVNSLIEESITSSQLEGAVTTREIAKGMIRSGRPARDISEQMILNNYRTMQYIRGLKDKPLTPSLICEIQKRVTTDTLDDPTAAGRIRRPDEKIDVADLYDEVFHNPPPSEELEQRMQAMCDFANGKTPDSFVHPIIRAILLHFWLAYDHPFKDGNGRSARAIFYWSMLNNDYWICEFISISQIIRRAPTQYYRSFLYTETDDNDLTYFILHHLGIIRKAVEELYAYIDRKTEETRLLVSKIQAIDYLNHRQRALISRALRHPNETFTIESHRVSHNVVHQTARTDLQSLAESGLLDARKHGRTWVFKPAAELEKKLRKLKDPAK